MFAVIGYRFAAISMVIKLILMLFYIIHSKITTTYQRDR